jgi:hypothetical protein
MSHSLFASRFLPLSLAVLLLASSASAEWKEQVLYSFQGGTTDGADPAGGVVFDKAGNLYGATTAAGPDNCFPIAGECGLVFQLSPPAKKGDPWTETILYQFKGKTSNDASVPAGGVILDAAGNVYGTTAYGGTGDCVLLGTSAGCGTVYELSPPAKNGAPWTETLLYSFKSGNDGYFPWGNLTWDSKGNLYGATQFGGGRGNTCNEFYGGNCGTVFELTPPKQKGGQWTEQVLHSFAGIANRKQSGDGANPNGGLILDKRGAIYGTTLSGGYNCAYHSGHGCGTIFALKPPAKNGGMWTETMLHRFVDGNDGASPQGGTVFDAKGYLYGTTIGTVFRLTPPSKKFGSWKKTLLFAFCNQNQGGCEPEDSLIFDASGRLYGTTYYGFGDELYGSVFRLEPPRKNGAAWVIDYLYGFVNAPDGLYPAARLIFDRVGNLYSTTTGGGQGTCSRYCGTVFEVSP